jgi:hypothetical protein
MRNLRPVDEDFEAVFVQLPSGVLNESLFLDCKAYTRERFLNRAECLQVKSLQISIVDIV